MRVVLAVVDTGINSGWSIIEIKIVFDSSRTLGLDLLFAVGVGTAPVMIVMSHCLVFVLEF